MQVTYCTYIFLQVALPVQITPRYGHSAVVFGNGPSFRVVVLFGGKRSVVGDIISETTLLLLGECKYVLLICLHRSLQSVLYNFSLIVLLLFCTAFLISCCCEGCFGPHKAARLSSCIVLMYVLTSLS